MRFLRKTGGLRPDTSLCLEERMECLTPSFSGGSESIAWRFDSSGMREGDERSGKFVILSDCGEYELPSM